MSKLKMNTRDKIRYKALEMFNERGIEYVGLRELAALLNMRVGNITYYFPTKDDLVYELSIKLSERNAGVMVTDEKPTMLRFLNMLHAVFQNHVQFKCLLLSFVHVMKQNKRVAEAYKTTQTNRSATIKSYIESLSANGYIQVKDESSLHFLVSTLALISRFWISESAISFRQTKDEEQMKHYLGLVTQLLLPYCTPKAKREIEKFTEGLQTA
jgi:AcrR family transcriptional regulator